MHFIVIIFMLNRAVAVVVVVVEKKIYFHDSLQLVNYSAFVRFKTRAHCFQNSLKIEV